MQFHIEDMTCGGCARAVTNAILSVDPAAKISTDPVSRRVDVDSSVPRAIIEDVLNEAGYPAAAP